LTEEHWQSLALLIHGQSKVGKTTCAATAPGKKLVLDAEGGWKWIAGSPDPNRKTKEHPNGEPYRRKTWDPSGPPPEDDGTWDFCVVNVQRWKTIPDVYRWLTQTNHPFDSFIMDSVTEIQRRCRQNIVGTEAMQMQQWGELLNQMEGVIRGYRDLANDPFNRITTTVFIAESKEAGKNQKIRPSMQGQIINSLPYWMDVVGYLYPEKTLDENGQPNGPEVRRLIVSQNDDVEAGQRVQGRLGMVVDRPNITKMMKKIYPDFVG
jgi:hypothetical protein